MRRVLLCCLVLLLSLPLAAKMRSFDQQAADQRRVISTYCRLDFEGGRLNPGGWAQMQKLSALHENPEFSFFYVIVRYQFEEDPTPTNDATVAYNVIGKYADGIGFTPVHGLLRATFTTHDHQGALLIENIDPDVPFVSRKAAIDWLKVKLTQQKDDAGRVPIQNAIRALEPPGTTAQSK